ncbi:hypothetical protein BD413DRAFT_193496 [Trametes elegans]|nr:hypothetical protein BD413DRAFT_193496 [Trametes elegans]
MTSAADTDADAAKETMDWEIVSHDWWKTSFRAISWSYKTKPACPRPPHYHNLLARGRRRRITVDTQLVEEDVDLNTGLSGVRAAEDVLQRYEVEASILSSSDVADRESPVDRCLAALAKEDWDEKVRELLGGILQSGTLPDIDEPPPDVPLWDLSLLEDPTPPPDSPSTAELTDSEASGESDPPPSTPRPTKTSYARVVSSETATSPTVLSPLPSKLLSAAALTFIPSTPNGPSIREPVTPPLTSASNSSGDSPFSSPTYNFHFPSLTSTSPADRRESRSLPPSLQKDESGFYVEVPEEAPSGTTQSLSATRSTTPRRPSAAFLPAFLTDGSPSPRARNSKTREIVDRLRSSGNSASNRKSKKAERTRRQPSASAAKDGDASTLPAAAADVKAAQKADDEGWISGVSITPPQQPQERTKPKHTHGHKRSSGSGSATQSSAASAPSLFSPGSQSNLPLPHGGAAPLPALPQLYASAGAFPYAPYAAPYAAGGLMPIQYPMPARPAQWPGGFQAGMYPMYQPFGMMPAAPFMVPVAPLSQPPAFYDGKSK